MPPGPAFRSTIVFGCKPNKSHLGGPYKPDLSYGLVILHERLVTPRRPRARLVFCKGPLPRDRTLDSLLALFPVTLLLC
jgi:hypothetical protein